MADYVAPGRVIDDDNRLLEYGRMLRGLEPAAGHNLILANWDVLTEVAGREPYFIRHEGREEERARLRRIRLQATSR